MNSNCVYFNQILASSGLRENRSPTYKSNFTNLILPFYTCIYAKLKLWGNECVGKRMWGNELWGNVMWGNESWGDKMWGNDCIPY